MIETVYQIEAIARKMTNAADEIEGTESAFTRTIAEWIERFDDFNTIKQAPLRLRPNTRTGEERDFVAPRDEVSP